MARRGLVGVATHGRSSRSFLNLARHPLLIGTIVLSASSWVIVAPRGVLVDTTGAPIVAVGTGSASGVEVVVHQSPFRMSFVDTATGQTVTSEVPAPSAPDTSATIFSPETENPVGATGAYAPLHFIVGANYLVQYPTALWSGDDISGSDAGVAFNPTRVESSLQHGNTWSFELATNFPGAGDAELTLTFDPEIPGQVHVSFTPPDGIPVAVVGDAFTSPPNEQFYDFGERRDAVDERGEVRDVYLEEENFGGTPIGQSTADSQPYTDPYYSFPNGPGSSYYPQAEFISSRGYGITLDDTNPSQWDMAADPSHPDEYRFQELTESPASTSSAPAESTSGGPYSPLSPAHLDYTLQVGGTPVDGQTGLRGVIAGLTAHNGRASVPPSFVHQPWIDNLMTGTGNLSVDALSAQSVSADEENLETTVADIEKYDLPVKVVGVEYWAALPAAWLTEFISSHPQFTFSAYFNCFAEPDDPDFASVVAKGLLLRNAAGEPYLIPSDEGGQPNGMLDFTNPAIVPYWEATVGQALSEGFRSFMLDFGEEVRDDMYSYSGLTGRELHNAYPISYDAVTHQVVDEWAAANHVDPNQIFFYVRSGYNGSSSSAGGVFPGDETTDWDTATGLPSIIPAMENLAVGGVSNFTTDIGGYADYGFDVTAELYLRWSELAALTPIMRVHTNELSNTYPWSFEAINPGTVDIWRTFAELHANLAGYLSQLDSTAASTGLGAIEPLYLVDPSTPESVLMHEYLLGPSLLVAPVLTQGSTSEQVFVPANTTVEQLNIATDGDLDPTGQCVSAGPSGGYVSVATPLDQEPVFLVNPTSAVDPALPLSSKATCASDSST